MESIVYGACPKHPGNSMLNCTACELEKSMGEIKLTKKEQHNLLVELMRLEENNRGVV